MQKYIDSSETYGKGLLKDKVCLSKDWWSSHLRQLSHLELVDIKFKILRTNMFAKTSRTYAVSESGQRFLEKPFSVYVLPPSMQNAQTNRENKKDNGRSNARASRHHLPKIRSLLKSNSSWFNLSKKEDYEYRIPRLYSVIVKTLRSLIHSPLARDLITCGMTAN